MTPERNLRAQGWAARHGDHLLVALMALVSSVAGVMNDFVYDDLPLIRDNVRVHGLAHWREILTNPYWPPPFVEQLYRPLATFAVAVEYGLGGGSPLVFRLVSYALYAASALAVLLLAKRLLPRWAALAAAVLFAVHPVHVEAIALGVNQGELIVGILAVAMLIRYVDRRRAGGLEGRDWAFLGVLYAAAALTKENGFVLPALLLAAELLPLDNAPILERTRKLGLGYTVLALVGAGMLLIRNAVLEGHVATVVTNRAFAGLNVMEREFAMLQVVPMWARLLTWPTHLQADYGPDDLVRHASIVPSGALGLGLVVAALAIIVFARRRAPVVCFGLAWCAVGLFPVMNVVPTGIVLAERTLFLPSIGFLIAAGAAGAEVARRWPGITTRRILIIACSVLALLGVARSVGRHRVWNSAHLVIVPHQPG
jgi:4-amino-4-deoxy-L-arabinose transferase-like glycosyltransferase